MKKWKTICMLYMLLSGSEFYLSSSISVFGDLNAENCVRWFVILYIYNYDIYGNTDLSESWIIRCTSIKHRFLYLYMCLQKTVSGSRISISIAQLQLRFSNGACTRQSPAVLTILTPLNAQVNLGKRAMLISNPISLCAVC